MYVYGEKVSLNVYGEKVSLNVYGEKVSLNAGIMMTSSIMIIIIMFVYIAPYSAVLFRGGGSYISI